jgi:arylsulfatase A-like enzyme
MTRGSKKLFNVIQCALLALGLACFSSIVFGLSAAEEAKSGPGSKPNILVLMVDDLGFDDLAINNGNTQIETPNMDQLARDGVRFTRHYASAVCSPARAAFLTGLHPERVGYLPNGRGISSELVTLPERLREHGYTTWHIGKWHIGDLDRTAWPDDQGFDHWFGFLNQWQLAGVHVDGELQLSRPTYVNPWLRGDTEPGKQFTGHLENILTDKAIDVISDLNAEQAPWFLNLWFYAPHAPVQPDSTFAAKYPDTPAGRYRALVNQLDTNIGRIVAHLESIGALNNTIIVVVSDNGGTNAAINNNAPFYGAKMMLTEGGLRTPLIIRWPDRALNGQVIADTVSIEDIYPTLLDSIGVTPPDNLDGSSFYATVQQLEPITRKPRFWDHVMTTTMVSYAMLSADGRWRLWKPPPLAGNDLDPVLNDLDVDPTGTTPVRPPPPAQLASMTESYRAWYQDVHTVKTTFAPGANGSGVLTGMSFLRTPGFGQYTFGIGLPDNYSGPVARQAGIWEMSRTGNKVIAKFGDLALSGEIGNDNSCHSIVIVGYFPRDVAYHSEPETVALTLYIDGVASTPRARDGILKVNDPMTETVIGDPLATGNVVALPAPVILNTALSESTPWTLQSFSQQLCAGK